MFRDSIRKRIQSLPFWNKIRQRLSARQPVSLRFKRASSGFLLLTSSAALAWGAQSVVQSATLEEWEAKRSPSEAIWKHSLEAYGYTNATKVELLERAVRRMPSTIDRPGHVWSSLDGNWMVIFRSTDSSPPQQVFCRSCEVKPEKWEPLGAGWRGFETALGRAMTSKPAKTREPGKKPWVFRDPREIQY